MKKLAFIFLLTIGSMARSFAQADTTKTILPDYSGWTNDYAHAFTTEEVRSLDSLISAYKKQSGVEIAILTTNIDLRDTARLEMFSLAVFNKWGVGKKEKNNGILFCIGIESRRIWIRNGDGIVPYLSNQETKTIIDRVIIPSFKLGEYYKGVYNAIIAIMGKLAKNGYK